MLSAELISIGCLIFILIATWSMMNAIGRLHRLIDEGLKDVLQALTRLEKTLSHEGDRNGDALRDIREILMGTPSKKVQDEIFRWQEDQRLRKQVGL